jgi:hypothetical protein
MLVRRVHRSLAGGSGVVNADGRGPPVRWSLLPCFLLLHEPEAATSYPAHTLGATPAPALSPAADRRDMPKSNHESQHRGRAPLTSTAHCLAFTGPGENDGGQPQLGNASPPSVLHTRSARPANEACPSRPSDLTPYLSPAPVRCIGARHGQVEEDHQSPSSLAAGERDGQGTSYPDRRLPALGCRVVSAAWVAAGEL